MKTKILVINNILSSVPEDIDYILNFSNVSTGHPKEVTFEKQFREKFDLVKVNYLTFLEDFSESSSFKDVPFGKSSFFRFHRFAQKDTWTDSFYVDITISLIIRNFLKEKGIENPEFQFKYKGTLYLEDDFKQTSIFKVLLKAMARITWYWIRLIKLKFSHPVENGTIKNNVFVSFYPIGIKLKGDKILHRQFFDVVEKLENASYVYSCLNIDKNIDLLLSKGVILENQLSWVDILSLPLKTNLFKYLFKLKDLKNQKVNFLNVEISSYINSLIVSDFYFYFVYQSRYMAFKRLIGKNDIKNIIVTGEYGPDALYVSLASKGSSVKCTWYQHTPYTPDKFWISVPRKWAIMGEDDPLAFPYPDEVLVWSDKYKSYLEKYTHTSSLIIRFVEQLQYYSVRVDKKVVVDKKYKLVFLPAVIKEEVFLFLEFANNLISKEYCQANEIFFKLHPDSSSYYNFDEMRSKFCTLEGVESSINILPTSELCSLSSHYIVGSSQMGLELMLYDASFSQYVPGVGVNFSPFFDSSDVQNFSNFDSLYEGLKKSKDGAKGFLAGYYKYPDNSLSMLAESMNTSVISHE